MHPVANDRFEPEGDVYGVASDVRIGRASNIVPKDERCSDVPSEEVRDRGPFQTVNAASTMNFSEKLTSTFEFSCFQFEVHRTVSGFFLRQSRPTWSEKTYP